MTSVVLAPPTIEIVTGHTGDDYFATETHYLSLAARIVAALRRGSSLVLVVGDPAPNPVLLSQALARAAAWRYAIIVVGRGPDLIRGQLLPLSPPSNVSALDQSSTDAVESAPLLLPLFIFENADKLSDDQIDDIYRSLPCSDGRATAAVLIAHSGFLQRLQRWKADPVKEAFNTCFRLEELGKDEIEAFIRYQGWVGKKESVFTAETITAIGDMSGGDPALVHRLARLLSAFPGSLGEEAESRPLHSLDETAGLDDTPKHSSLPDTTAPALPGSPRRRRLTRALHFGLFLCIALVGIVAVPGETLRSLVHSTEQKLAALRSLDFGTPRQPAKVTIDHRTPISDVVAAKATKKVMPSREKVASPGIVAQRSAVTSAAAPSAKGAPPVPPTKTDNRTATAAHGPASALISALSSTTTPGSAKPHSSKQLSGETQPRLSTTAVAALIARGDDCIGTGDIASARSFFERAVEAGDGRAALRMGATFDPAFLNQAGIHGVVANQQEAISWYRRARDLGQAEAELRLKQN
jgi:hypothetical protein